MTSHRAIPTGSFARRCAAGSMLAGALLLQACNLSVENPGPVQDANLTLATAHQAVVNGAGRALANATASGTGGSLAFDAAAISREIHPGGQTGSFGISPQLSVGYLTPDETSGNTAKTSAARWIAEDGIRRIRGALSAADFAKSPIAAQGLLYVGFVNRLIGENMCETTIDGGPKLPFMVHFARAESAFTEALAIAQAANNTTFANAALGGRASVRTWQGNWAGAATDAALVPKTFKWQNAYYNTDREVYNAFFFAMDGSTFRNESMWHTWYADIYDQYKDPRTRYLTFTGTFQFTQGTVGDLGDGRGVIGKVPFFQQQKYTAVTSPLDLTDGREAMLIVAESKLRGGDVAGTMALVNTLRTDAGVTLRNTAVTSDSAWSYLKQEVLIEVFLEGRALGYRRRWSGAGKDPVTPGGLPALLTMTDRPGKDSCFPIGRTELNTNPNLVAP